MRERRAAWILVLLAASACGGDDGGVDPEAPPPLAPTATIAGRVSAEGAGLAGVSVSRSGPGASQSAATGSDGSFRFTSVPLGSHVVTLSGGLPGDVVFPRTTVQVTLSAAGQEARADFPGEYLRTSSLRGTVAAFVTGTRTQPVEGAILSLGGLEAAVDTTGAGGRYEFTALRPGEYAVSLREVDGYVFEEPNFLIALAAGQAGEHDFIGARDLYVVTDSLAPGRVSVPFSRRLEAFGGSREGFVWSLREGSRLPGGLQLLGDGTIQGTPLATGLAEFGVAVTDSEMKSATANLSLRICKGSLGLQQGDYEVFAADEVPGPCGFYIRAPEADAYYRITIVETDGESRAIHDVSLRTEGLSSGQAAAGRVARTPPEAGVARPSAPRRLPGTTAMRAAAWTTRVEAAAATASLHARLRRREDELLRHLAATGRLHPLPDRPRAGAMAERGAERPEPPAQQDFRLSNNLGSCTLDTTVTATLTAHNDRVIVYEYATSSSIEHVQRAIDYYSDHGSDIIDDYFGGVGDVNGDGTVTVLVRPDMRSRGFVWLADLVVPQSECAASNEREIIYISDSEFKDLERDSYWAFGTLVHEMKHVSSAYKRARRYARGGQGSTLHPLWIEEGTADIAKEAASRLAWERAGGPLVTDRVTGDMIDEAYDGAMRPEVWGVFDVMALTVYAFSGDPDAITFEPPGGQGSIYGSGWHFHRFLRDRIAYGGRSPADDASFMRELNDSLTASGIEGIEAVTGRPMAELLEKHAVAMTFAGSEGTLDADVPRFATYDFPSATRIFTQPNPPGIYPWPVTTAGENQDGSPAPIAVPLGVAGTRTFNGRLASSGLRMHDFRASRSGEGAVFHVALPSAARVIVARIRDPEPPKS